MRVPVRGPWERPNTGREDQLLSADRLQAAQVVTLINLTSDTSECLSIGAFKSEQIKWSHKYIVHKYQQIQEINKCWVYQILDFLNTFYTKHLLS